MLQGDFDAAWQESRRIAEHNGSGDLCLWDGQPFDGKRVIIRCLHGFGDAIQFIRYARFMRRSTLRIIVECAMPLVSLFKCQPCLDEVISWDDGTSSGFSRWDQQIEVMELPRAFQTNIESIPAEVPYLTVPKFHVEPGADARVGLVWSASDWNPARSVPFQWIDALLRMDRVSFYSFQHGECRSDLHGAHGIRDTAPDCPTILDTACALSGMDLLITVDTMAAHLGGALGIPVWLLLPFQADWRWMLDRSDSPWYPTMRLFRQPEPGDWETPLTELAAELRRFPSRTPPEAAPRSCPAVASTPPACHPDRTD